MFFLEQKISTLGKVKEVSPFLSKKSELGSIKNWRHPSDLEMNFTSNAVLWGKKMK